MMWDQCILKRNKLIKKFGLHQTKILLSTYRPSFPHMIIISFEISEKENIFLKFVIAKKEWRVWSRTNFYCAKNEGAFEDLDQ